MMLRVERHRPLREHPRQHARVFVVARPLHRFATALEVRIRLGPCASRLKTPLEAFERLTRLLGAVNASGAEEDYRVLDVLRLESAQWLEILGEDTKRSRFFALEKLLVPVSKRLGMHGEILS